MSRTLYMILFGLFAITVVGGVHYYLWLRLIKGAALPSPWHQIGTGVIIALAVSMPLTMFVSRALPLSTSRYLTFVPYLWMGVMLLLVFYFVGSDLVRLFAFLGQKLFGSAPPDPERRLLLGRIVAGGGALVVGGMTTAAVIGGTSDPEVAEVDVPLAGLPEPFRGLRIVQLSDLHLGISYGKEWLARVVAKVNALEPDVVAITGDLIDGFVDQMAEEIAPLKELKATHGAYFVTGNHEYYFGAPEWCEAVAATGVRVLRNERVALTEGGATLYLAGVDDYSSKGMAEGHGPDLARALEGRDEAIPVVLLAHQPREIAHAAEHQVDLVLSGHTHAGQIWPFGYFVRLQQPYNRGLARHSDRTWIYVNPGTGVWGPSMRLGSKNEITSVTLTSA